MIALSPMRRSDDLTALTKAAEHLGIPAPDDQPLGLARGDFIATERHNGAVWVMVGDKPFARVIDQEAIPAFWQAYNRALAVTREQGRQGI